MGADAFFVGKHATGWPADPGAGGDLASSRFLSGNQSALPRALDRLDPADHAGRAGAGIRFFVVGSRLLLRRHRGRNRHRMGDRSRHAGKIGECFERLGFADAVLIKHIFGNGDLESSQWRSGVPEGTARVSVAARDLSFLTEILGPSVGDVEKAQNVG